MKLVKIFLLVFATVQCQLNSEYSNDHNKRQVGSIRDSEEVSSIVSNTINPNLISVNSAESSIGSISYYGSTLSDYHLIPSFLFAPDASSIRSFSNETLIRMKRASQEAFSSMVDNLSVSARLITAISLQNGLIDQSIPADKALAELLNIGSVDMEQLETFDKTKVNGFAKNLTTLALQLKTSVDQKKIEDTIVILDSWRQKFTAIGDLNDLNAAKLFFSKITALNSTKFENATITAAIASITDAIPLISKIPDLPDDTKTNNSHNWELGTQLKELRKSLEGVSKAVPEVFTALIKYDEELGDFNFESDYPQKKFVDLMNVYFSTKGMVDRETEETIRELSADIVRVQGIDSSARDIEILKSVLYSQRPGSTFTSSDLNRIFADSQNQLFTEMSGISAEKLKTGLENLKDLDAKLTIVQTSWKPITGDQQQVFKLLKIFETLKSNLVSDAEGSIQRVTSSISKPQDSKQFTVKANKIFKESRTLLRVIKTIHPFISSLLQSSLLDKLSDASELIELAKFGPDLKNHLEEVPDVIAKVKEFKKSEQFVKTLNELKSMLGEIQKKIGATVLNQIVKDLSNGEAEIEALIKDPATTNFVTFFKSFDSVGEELKSLGAAVQLIREVRELQTNAQFTQDVGAVTEAIGLSLSAIKNLRGVPKAIKDNGSNVLVKLKGLEKESKIFGESVKALDDVKKVLEKKADVEKFLVDGDSVEAAIQNEQEPKRSELFDYWGDFEKTKSELTYLFAELESRRDMVTAIGTRRRRATRGFSSYQAAFSAFIGLKSVDLEAEKRLEVLSALNQTTLLTTMDSLGSLNLNFAGFNGPLSKIPSTLEKIDTIFRNAVARPSTPSSGQTPPPADAQVSQAVPLQSSPGEASSTTEEPHSSGIGFGAMVAIVCGVLLVCAVIVGAVLHFRFGFFRKKKDSTKPPVPDVEIQNTPVATPKKPDENVEKVAELEKKNKQLTEENEQEKQNRIKAEQEAEKNKQLVEKNEQERLKKEQMEKQANAKKPKKEKKDLSEVVKKNNLKNQNLYELRKTGGRIVFVWKAKDNVRFNRKRCSIFIVAFGWFPGQEGSNVYEILKSMHFVDKETLISQYYALKARPTTDMETVEADPQLTRGNKYQFISDSLNPQDSKWIHANVMVMPVYGSIFIAQGPLLESPAHRDHLGRDQCAKKDTRRNFLYKIMWYKMPHIVMTCAPHECAPYFTADKLGTMQIFEYTVTVKTCQAMFNGEIERRDLEISHFQNNEKVTVRCVHWCFMLWPEGKGTPWSKEYPHFFDAFVHVQQQTQHTDEPIMVHGAMGTGRSGVFAGAQYVYQTLSIPNIPLNYWNMVNEMRSCRLGLLDNGYQFFYTLCAGYHLFVKSCNSTDTAVHQQWHHCSRYYIFSPSEFEQHMKFVRPGALKKEVVAAKEVPQEKEVGDEKTVEQVEVEEVKKEEEPLELDFNINDPPEIDSDKSNSRKQRQIRTKEEQEKRKLREIREKKAIREGEIDVSFKGLTKAKSQQKDLQKAPSKQSQV